MLILDVFFFFKQKTAYEMRISDWSSDVCSSDLRRPARRRMRRRCRRRTRRRRSFASLAMTPMGLSKPPSFSLEGADDGQACPSRNAARSEEHTSELQSLMRISYAVFCLKKQKTTHRPRS